MSKLVSERTNEQFPRAVKLGRFKGHCSVGKLNKTLPNARFLLVLVIEDDEKSDQIQLHSITHGTLKKEDKAWILQWIMDYFKCYPFIPIPIPNLALPPKTERKEDGVYIS